MVQNLTNSKVMDDSESQALGSSSVSRSTGRVGGSLPSLLPLKQSQMPITHTKKVRLLWTGFTTLNPDLGRKLP